MADPTPSRDSPLPPTWLGSAYLVETVRGSIDAPLGWFAFLLFWFSMATYLGRDLLPAEAQSISPGLALAAVPMAVLVALLHRLRTRFDLQVSVDDSALHLLKKKRGSTQCQLQTSIARRAIRTGHLRPRGGGAEVELHLTDRTILRLAFASRADATAMLAALGRDAAHRPATIAVPGIEGRYGLGCFSAFVHLLLFGLGYAVLRFELPVLTAEISVLYLLVNVVVSYLFVRAARPREVTIGLDAVVVRGPFLRRTIPWSRIERFDRSTVGVHIDLAPPPGAGEKARRKTLLLRTGSNPRESAALCWRLEEAQKLRATIDDDRLLSRMAREGRKLQDWRSAVGFLLGGGEGYRRAAVSIEALRAIAASPTAKVEQRVGAALAIGAARDREACESVRAASRAVVSPRLRIALREAVRPNPDERAIEEALAEEEAVSPKIGQERKVE